MSDTPLRLNHSRTTPSTAEAAGRAAATAPATAPAPAAGEVAEEAVDAVFERQESVGVRSVQRRRGKSAAPRLPRPIHNGEVGVYMRSFHPSATFGGAFGGDDRGFSTNLDDTARVQSGIVLGSDLEVAQPGRALSSPSHHPLLGTATGRPRSESRVTRLDDNTIELRVDYAGGNPLTPSQFTPDADVHARFRIEDRSPTELHIQTSVRGDTYPSAETFVTDPQGNAVFLGARAIQNWQDIPEIAGDRNEPMIESDVTIIRDADTGEFQAVESGGRRYSLEEWNAAFESLPALRDTAAPDALLG